MARSRFIEIDGKRHLWRDILALRRAQALPKAEQPTLFPVREDSRPAPACSASGRYREPSLFAEIERTK
jgi:hypothetical protein